MGGLVSDDKVVREMVMECVNVIVYECMRE